MATDIFRRQSDSYGGSFSADGALLTFTDGSGILGDGLVGSGNVNKAGEAFTGVGLLLQSLSIGYTQQVTRLYEIGTTHHFFIAGRTQGNIGAQRVLGPRPLSIAFYNKYGDVCNAATNNFSLTLATGCSSVGGFTDPTIQNNVKTTFFIDIRYSVINSLGIAMNAQDSIISENLAMMFCFLRISSPGIAK